MRLSMPFSTNKAMVKDFAEGVTAPPFHPRCRTTTMPAVDDEWMEGTTRIARGADGKTYSVPADMKYEDWKKKFAKDVASEKDISTYKKYTDIIGMNAPSSMEEFIKIRYNDINWNLFKSYAGFVKSGELTPLSDFKLFKDTSNEIDSKLVGLITNNGITITGKSKHFIARVIGSAEQKRNGVSVGDIFKALTHKDAEFLSIKKLSNGKSQKIRFNGVEVSINPGTGNLIQVNPIKRSIKK
ncbi:MAG: hypothetical protein RSB80_03930 [Anaerovoracaceae bacterium]